MPYKQHTLNVINLFDNFNYLKVTSLQIKVLSILIRFSTTLGIESKECKKDRIVRNLGN
jgi:hypothetical protein